MSLKKNSELYIMIQTAVAEALNKIEKPLTEGSFKIPRGTMKKMKKLVRLGRTDYQIQDYFLNRFAFSGCTDRNFIIRYVNTSLQLVRKTG